ncbi:hypothetical protein [Lactiplantibacillus plantarum]|uniref:hypothetical protein n=1 Tax=Lactiplantibacillus plantarum TaxID=1590 RepID=UPI001B8392B8|nr:hypothetical protein [Lactiplantibacillus plantarum]GIQ94184.1 hypothetical protein COY2906_10540 [Lactiplantibacillus plantarum]
MNIGKKIWTITVIICYLILIGLSIFNPLFDSKTVKTIETVFSLTTALVIYGYNHWNWLFVDVRKVWVYFRGDTVSWQGEYRCFINDTQQWRTLVKKFMQEIEKDSDVIHSSPIQEGYTDISLTHNGVNCTVKLSMDEGPGYKAVLIAYSASTAYRDSKEQVVFFRKLINILNRSSESEANLANVDMAESLHNSLSVNIALKRYNPFYRILLHHFDRIDKSEKWQLSVTNKNVKVNMKPHNLKVQGRDVDAVFTVLKEYIAVSTIG